MSQSNWRFRGPARYNTWAASKWNRNHDGPPTYVLGENGQKDAAAAEKSLCNHGFSESLTSCLVGQVSAFRRPELCPGGFILPR